MDSLNFIFMLLLPLAYAVKERYNVEEVTRAIQATGFWPPSDRVQSLVNEMDRHRWGEGEQLMFLAHVVHESAGLNELEEEGCESEKCQSKYLQGCGGRSSKSYHGRGFLHLTGDCNYRTASERLRQGDRLLSEPELVRNDMSIAAKTAISFWMEDVNPKNRRKAGQRNSLPSFGDTTKKINSIECHHSLPQAQRRWYLYRAITKALGAPQASESGCY